MNDNVITGVFSKSVKEHRTLHPIDNITKCTHPALAVVKKTRMLQCINCETIIDPFDFLLDVALKEQSLANTCDRLSENVKGLFKEIDELETRKRRLLRYIRLDKIFNR